MQLTLHWGSQTCNAGMPRYLYSHFNSLLSLCRFFIPGLDAGNGIQQGLKHQSCGWLLLGSHPTQLLQHALH